MSDPAPLPTDPRDLMRSRQYRLLLVLSAIVGLVVSAAAWVFLVGVDDMQRAVWEDLPDALGFDSAPVWWALPWLALAGLVTGIAVARLPGRGGHVPADGLKAGGKQLGPRELPGVLLAAVATLGLGLVLGPEAPLIAVGTGIGIFAVQRLAPDAPPQTANLLAVAGAFAAISTIFGSPVMGAVLLIEAAAIGGAMLPVVLLPGLMAAGIGSLVFTGLGSWSGLSTSAWSLAAFPLPAYGGPDWTDFGWTILLAVATALTVFVIVTIGRGVVRLTEGRVVPVTIAAGLAVAVIAMLFHAATDLNAQSVLFSGQSALGDLFVDAGTVSLGTFGLLILFKSAAWAISLGGFRGGPTFPAIFLGAAAGLLAGHLPGYSITPGVAALVGAACVAVLRLPLASVMIASFLSVEAGLSVTPLVVTAVVIAYLVTLGLSAALEHRLAPAGDEAAAEAGTAPPPDPAPEPATA